MSKKLFIAEKPSVARQFASALGYRMRNGDGFMESEEAVVTWCVGHLVSMSYPEVYDEKYKRWSLATIPFIPTEWKYEVIPSVAKQFRIVAGLLNRPDVDTIYICTDSGREGEYIYRLVDAQAHVTGKTKKRVWIDSQTDEEILRGIREAKDDSAYDGLGAAAYLRAKEDYLMGINFSRALTLKYGDVIKNCLGSEKRCVIAVGRVMTCVLGIVVEREREIRSFVPTPFYRIETGVCVTADRAGSDEASEAGSLRFTAQWTVNEKSPHFGSPALYKENGFLKKKDAEGLIREVFGDKQDGVSAVVEKAEHKTEKKSAPLLYNLAELQNDCSRFFKLSPDETLNIAQELYEKKLTTYPRTDARVLSTAIAKVIKNNIDGLTKVPQVSIFAQAILKHESWKGIAKTRYVNDKAITDHYAIIPTGQGLGALNSLSPMAAKVYELIARRFLAVFYPQAVWQKTALVLSAETTGGMETFKASFKALQSKGYLHVLDTGSMKKSGGKKETAAEQEAEAAGSEDVEEKKGQEADGEEVTLTGEEMLSALAKLKKGSQVTLRDPAIREGETTPPKRYSSGTMILTMENAGQFIEDEELRAQIKGSGIGTSATRAGILEKLFKNRYLSLNRKTQIITPTLLGEMIYDTVACSMKPMLNPALTASWEKGLTMVAGGELEEDAYMQKLDGFVRRRTEGAKENDYSAALRAQFERIAGLYPAWKDSGGSGRGSRGSGSGRSAGTRGRSASGRSKAAGSLTKSGTGRGSASAVKKKTDRTDENS
ncbi:MAG: type IA DNA topoisomerase [Lachnospiraceae bacterium]|nr:type IA DNA topoisomerase [Lachnospiraceae bacterium]